MMMQIVCMLSNFRERGRSVIDESTTEPPREEEEQEEQEKNRI